MPVKRPTSQRIEAIASCSQILRKTVIDLCVTRDWGLGAVRRIGIYRVTTTFALQTTPMAAK